VPQRLSVWVAEEDSAIRTYLQEQLQDLGHSVSAVSDKGSTDGPNSLQPCQVFFTSQIEEARQIRDHQPPPFIVWISNQPNQSVPPEADAQIVWPVTPSTLWDLLLDILSTPALEGLDTKAGLARAGGNRKLYRKLLRQFLEQENTPQKIAETPDPQEAQRLAHTLKGLAGNVGASAIQAAAAALEKALREQSDPSAPRAQLQSRLTVFTQSLRAALPADAPADAPTDPSQEPLQAHGPVGPALAQAVAEMDTLLHTFDVAAIELFEARRSLFRPLFSSHELALFESHLSQFGLAEARQALRQAAQRREIPLP